MVVRFVNVNHLLFVLLETLHFLVPQILVIQCQRSVHQQHSALPIIVHALLIITIPEETQSTVLSHLVKT